MFVEYLSESGETVQKMIDVRIGTQNVHTCKWKMYEKMRRRKFNSKLSFHVWFRADDDKMDVIVQNC